MYDYIVLLLYDYRIVYNILLLLLLIQGQGHRLRNKCHVYVKVLCEVFSSPEQEVLMVSYCGQSLSVVRVLSTFHFKQLLLQIG